MDLCYDVELCNLVYGYVKMHIKWIFLRYNACNLWYFNVDVKTVDFIAES